MRVQHSSTMVAALSLITMFAHAQEKKEDAVPAITAFAPFELSPAGTTKIRVRGAKLTNTTAIEFPGVGAAIQSNVKEKKAAEVPNGQDAKRVGDTQVEFEITLPADTAVGRLPFRLVTAEGVTAPRELLVVDAKSRADEKEPNNGFSEAQQLEAGVPVRGSIQEDKDVDVYRVNLTAGRKVSCAIFAADCGALLDPVLTIFDERGNILAATDDSGDSRDSRTFFTPAITGACFVTVSDANDRGGPWHTYTLEIREALP